LDLQLTPEQLRLRAEVEAFLRRELPPEWAGDDMLRDDTDAYWEFSRAFGRKLAATGWPTMHWPVEYGGQAADRVTLAVYNETLAYHEAPRNHAVISGVSLLGGLVLTHGTEEQKQRFLPPLRTNDLTAVSGHSEPGAGSDLAALQTSALRDGDEYVVNGQKVWNSYAHRVDWIVLAARTDPGAPRHRGISVLLVERRAPGVTVRPIENMAGGHPQAVIYFDNVRVPRTNLIGEEHRGWYILNDTRFGGGSPVAAPAGMRRLFDDFVRYCRGTTRNGVPLSADPIVRHRLADLGVSLNAWYWLAWRQISMAEHGARMTEARTGGGLHSLAGSVTSLLAKEWKPAFLNAVMDIADLPALLRSGSPWAPWAGKMERHYRASFDNHRHGTPEILRMVVATRGLGLPRD
jgi:alkylation response protein AidB-like acyl-CoA dehydrogenase